MANISKANDIVDVAAVLAEKRAAIAASQLTALRKPNGPAPAVTVEPQPAPLRPVVKGAVGG
jgi:hypothetical protein